MKSSAKVLILSAILAFVCIPQSIFAQESDEYNDDYVSENDEGDYYDTEEDIRLTQNGAGDQFISIKLMPLFPLNFGEQLYIGGALSLGYHRFLNEFFAVGADVMFGYNTTIGSNIFTIIPFSVGITYQPYIKKFEFPITLSIGAVIENYVQYNYFPGLMLKAEAGVYYRINENWSAGIESQFIWLPQWYADSSKNDQYIGVTATLAARYHF